eukprot:GFYU01036611.1.p1 GENE.GFYU01036611.1~~GFYU01036611.1.p1  ORF type:complete len:243 (-),score=70.18 GFYU01036611.1:99-827(-)
MSSPKKSPMMSGQSGSDADSDGGRSRGNSCALAYDITPDPARLEAERQELEKLVVPANEHALETAWSFWFDRKLNPKQTTNVNYEENLKRLGTFKTIESFWRFYTHLSKPHQLPRECNMHLFRDLKRPMWETFPHGGCWILKIKKRNQLLSRVWEELCFAAVGEAFDEIDVVGIQLSMRKQEDLISIWNANASNQDIRFRIGEKLKEILHLDPSMMVEYKNHSTSMKDGSTFRNAKAYVFQT